MRAMTEDFGKETEVMVNTQETQEMWLKTAENMFVHLHGEKDVNNLTFIDPLALLEEAIPYPTHPNVTTRDVLVTVAKQGAEAMRAVAAELRVQRDMLRELRTQIEHG